MQTKSIKLIWWNLNNFFHFDPTHSQDNEDRWPKTLGEYQEKTRRVDAAINSIISTLGEIDIFAFAEITSQAAHELRDRLLPKHKVISLDVKKDKPTMQIAILYRSKIEGLKISEELPIVVPDMPRGTRAMGVLELKMKNQSIRLVFSHWQPRIGSHSEDLRRALASYLSKYSFDYLLSSTAQHKNHIVLCGDFNDEPFDDSLRLLNSHRHRARAQGKMHWKDKDVRRVHLYNCSWRLLGEQKSHISNPSNPMRDAAGTYYWEKEKSWHNLDHFVVSGGLLSNNFPHIDESDIAIISLPELIPEGIPKKFSATTKSYAGLSDHLPIFASINLEK